MTNLTFGILREANLKRLPLFKNKNGQLAHSKSDGSDWSINEWIEAVIGEIGEYANFSKKLRRNDLVLDQIINDIGKEIADIAIYMDILAYRIEVELIANHSDKFLDSSIKVENTQFNYNKYNDRSVYTQKILIELLKLNKWESNYQFIQHLLMVPIHNIWGNLFALVKYYNLTLADCIISKFNEVSYKFNIPVFISSDGTKVTESMDFN